MRAMGVAALAAVAIWGAAPAFSVEPEMVEAAKQIQSSCMAHGENAAVCACSVGLAYDKLDPKVFRLMPKLQPILDQKDKTTQLMGLLSVASQNGLSVTDVQGAADTIRSQREIVGAICKPLALVRAPAKRP